MIAERAHGAERAPVDFVDAGHELGDRAALAFGDFAQALRIGRIGGADDDHRLDLAAARLTASCRLVVA